MSDARDVVSEAKSGLGYPASALGIFFFVQSYGYARGSGLQPPASIADGVTQGMVHLAHFVTPLSDVAWPLTPSLCGLLLLYCTHLPDQLRRAAEGNAEADRANRYFFAVLMTLVLSAMLAGIAMWRPSLIESIADIRTSPFGWGQPFVYGGLVALGVWISNRLLLWMSWHKAVWPRPGAPWPNLIALASMALLYMIAFAGSDFDGRLDRAVGLLAR